MMQLLNPHIKKSKFHVQITVKRSIHSFLKKGSQFNEKETLFPLQSLFLMATLEKRNMRIKYDFKVTKIIIRFL